VAVATKESGEFRERVDRSVLVLFASIIEGVSWATAALLDQDVDTADRVIADDRNIDARCDELIGVIKDRLSSSNISPDELEDLVAVLQMVPELERSADLAEHIAQRTRQGLGGSISPRCRGLIQSMGDADVKMWQLASRAYAQRSRDLSFRIREIDDQLDELCVNLVREGVAGGADPAVAAELALVARFYERLGDHAVNIAKRIAAMAGPKRMSPIRALARRHRSRGAEGIAARPLATIARLFRTPPAPAESGFFDLFEAATANARDGAEELRKMLATFQDIEEHYQEIRGLERRGDQITVDLLRQLDANFITPYDREDIHALTEALDDVIDDVFSAAELIHLIPLDEPLPEVTEIGELLAVMAQELDGLIASMRTRDGARHRLERIEALEREGDALYRRGIARLFSGEYEALEVLKWKDILQALENSVNQVEDVSNVVESILVKNS
jgi:predicted phosphate transport protein (TIGR00153 family)